MLAVLWPVHFLAASAAPTNSVAVHIAKPDLCIERMQKLVAEVTTLQNSITNDTIALERVVTRLSKMKRLLASARVSAERLREDGAKLPENDESLDEERARILVAYQRVERLAAEAAGATGLDSPPVASAGPATPKAPTSNEPLQVVSERDERGCVSQGDVARLLTKAMELIADPRDSKVACDELAKRDIEPLGGWQINECMTLPDFGVVLSKVLGLRLDPAEGPAVCLQALRTEGLPLNLLPPHVEGRHTPLREEEVRAFLATGRASRPER